MKLEILIATINDGIYNTENIFFSSHPNITYLVSHQITHGKSYEGNLRFLDREDIRYVTMEEKGLAKNRNNCLLHAKGDLLLICDDDVEFIEENVLKVAEVFAENTDVDLVRFQVMTFSGKSYKKYPENRKLIRSVRSLTSFSSIEMVVSADFIDKTGVRFDERFGIASVYPVGEDFIFAADVMKSGGNILHYPMHIVLHEDEGTGGKVEQNIIYGRGAVFARVFGWFALPLDVFFTLKHREKYKKIVGMVTYLAWMLSGSIDLLKRGRMQ